MQVDSKLKINAVVVTYNRKKLLENCLNALLNQTYILNKIFVIDNFSNDGTEQFLNQNANKQISSYRLNKNYGGAGGFYYGVKKAYLDGCDYVWIMDDDVEPSKDALEELINATKIVDKNTSYYASYVHSKNGKPMNVPAISDVKEDNGCIGALKYIDSGIVKITAATFVSLLINSKAIEKVGAPHPDFFIWGDDTEYTLRLTKYYGPAYIIGKSKVLHNRESGNELSILKENNIDRIKLYTYFYRNNLVVTKNYMTCTKFLKAIAKIFRDLFMIIFTKNEHKLLKLKVIIKAVMQYLTKNYGHKNFVSRFSNINEDLVK